MAKALGSIITLAAAVVVNVVPGLGQLASAAILVGAALVSAGINSLLAGSQKHETTKRTIKEPIPPRVYAYGRSRLFGANMLYETASDGATVDVYAYCQGPVDAIEIHYLNDRAVTVSGGIVQPLDDESYGGSKVRVGVNLGAFPNTAHAAVIAKVPALWTSAHRGDGVVSGYLIKNPEKSKDFLKTYPQGDGVDLSIVGRWKKCLDPRNGTTGWTENSILHFLDYLVNIRGVDYTTQIVPRLSYWIAAANICDEQIELAEGGTENRYRSSVTFSTTTEPKSTILAFLETFDGFLARMGDGSYVVYAGKGYAPTVSIGSDEIIGYSFQDGVPDEDRVNQLVVSYISAAHDYQVVETTPWGDIKGVRRAEQFSPQSPSYSQNRRLAKRLFGKRNPALSGSIQCNLGARAARGERFINLTIEENGMTFFDGVAEITGYTRNFSEGVISIDWIAYDANVDAWNPNTEQGEAASLGDRIARQPLDAPVITTASAIFSPSTDGGTGVRLQVIVSSTGRDDEQWVLRWRIGSSGTWNEQEYPDTDPGASVTLISGFVPANQTLQVQVAYVLGDGRVSPFSASSAVVTDTFATPPGAAPAPTLDRWGAALVISVGLIERASTYRWRIYESDGTTLIRTVTTTSRTLIYDNTLAFADGIKRAYVIDVAGVNSAGTGTVGTSAALSKPAPGTLTGFDATGGDTDASITFTALPTPPTDFTGYAVFYSSVDGFDPATQGQVIYTSGTTVPIYGLVAGTYYARAAAYDSWSDRPGLLNLTAQDSFVIAIGGGGFGGGGSGGGGSGGPEPILEPIP